MRTRAVTITLTVLCLSAPSALAAPGATSPPPLRWTQIASLPTARGGLVSVTADGQIFAIGGATSDFDQTLNTVEAYDPLSRIWRTVTSAGLTPRADLGAASADGRIYAIGGYDSNGNASAAVEFYDPRDPAAGWRSEAPLPIVSPSGWAGAGGIAAAGYHGLIYAVGGYDQDGNLLANLEIYNPRTNTWTAGPPMPTARGLLRATFADGRLYAVGGFDSTGTIPFDTVEGYDPTTHRWTTEAPIPIPRAEPALATLTDGQVVAAGAAACPARPITGHRVLSSSATPSSTARGITPGTSYPRCPRLAPVSPAPRSARTGSLPSADSKRAPMARKLNRPSTRSSSTGGDTPELNPNPRLKEVVDRTRPWHVNSPWLPSVVPNWPSRRRISDVSALVQAFAFQQQREEMA